MNTEKTTLLSDLLKFHHIGVATSSVENASKFYLEMGYSKSETFNDPIQKVNICFMQKNNMPQIELIEPASDDSPITKTLQKNNGAGTTYHICYKVNNINEAIALLKKSGFLPLSKPVNAVAMEKSIICFLFHRYHGLIELVEK